MQQGENMVAGGYRQREQKVSDPVFPTRMMQSLIQIESASCTFLSYGLCPVWSNAHWGEKSGCESCNKSFFPGEGTKTIAHLVMLGVQGHPLNSLRQPCSAIIWYPFLLLPAALTGGYLLMPQVMTKRHTTHFAQALQSAKELNQNVYLHKLSNTHSSL